LLKALICSSLWLVDGQIESGRKPLAWEVVRQAEAKQLSEVGLNINEIIKTHIWRNAV